MSGPKTRQTLWRKAYMPCYRALETEREMVQRIYGRHAQEDLGRRSLASGKLEGRRLLNAICRHTVAVNVVVTCMSRREDQERLVFWSVFCHVETLLALSLSSAAVFVYALEH